MKTGHERNQESLNQIFNARQSIKSAADTIQCVYVSDIQPQSWTKQLALSAIENSVTNYGCYDYNGRIGMVLVGDFEDIHSFIESNGMVVDEDYIYHWKQFDWDNAKKLDKRYSGQDYWNRKGLSNSRRPIKSETYRDVVIAWSDDFSGEEMASLIRDKFDISVSYFMKDGDFAIAISSWDYNSKILNFIKRKVNVTSFEFE